MRRREFITIFAGAAAAWPVGAQGQQPKLPVVGLLEGAGFAGQPVGGFHQGLSDMGYAAARNLMIESRSAAGQYDQLPALAAELVRRQVAVIAAFTPIAALAAKTATATIPVVFLGGSDPVKDGLVASLNRPGGNVTGITFFANVLSSKRLELLHELVPKAGVIGLLLNPSNANAAPEQQETESAAAALGLKLLVEKAGTEREIDAAFADLVRRGATALQLAGDAYFFDQRDQIGALAAHHGIPVSVGSREAIAGGALMSYGADRLESARQWGRYVGRVLKGEKPADLPVMLPSKFEFVINLKAAKSFGLSVSNSMQLLADEVIE
jgi:putative ABC transport system substrate-binding protein